MAQRAVDDEHGVEPAAAGVGPDRLAGHPVHLEEVEVAVPVPGAAVRPVADPADDRDSVTGATDPGGRGQRDRPLVLPRRDAGCADPGLGQLAEHLDRLEPPPHTERREVLRGRLGVVATQVARGLLLVVGVGRRHCEGPAPPGRPPQPRNLALLPRRPEVVAPVGPVNVRARRHLGEVGVRSGVPPAPDPHSRPCGVLGTDLQADCHRPPLGNRAVTHPPAGVGPRRCESGAGQHRGDCHRCG